MKLLGTLMPLLSLSLSILFLPTPCAALPALSIVPDAGETTVAADTASWNFGTQPLSRERPLLHRFHLRNATKTILTIERVALSCDCVQAQIGSASTLPVKILPGQTVPVSVSLTMHRLVPGTVSKSAWLYLRGGSTSGLRLEMHGMVHDDSSPSTP